MNDVCRAEMTKKNQDSEKKFFTFSRNSEILKIERKN